MVNVQREAHLSPNLKRRGGSCWGVKAPRGKLIGERLRFQRWERQFAAKKVYLLLGVEMESANQSEFILHICPQTKKCCWRRTTFYQRLCDLWANV